VNDERFLYARLPYRRHSGHYLEDHPPERFGCTVCHGGKPGASDFASAGHPRPASSAREHAWASAYGWSPPGPEGMYPLQVLAGRCALCHSGADGLRAAQPYRQARKRIAHLRCAACHELRDEPRAPVQIAVHLDHLGSKLNPSWLARFLEDPPATHASAAMPAFPLSEDELQALVDTASSLTDDRIPRDPEETAVDPAAAARGLEIVRERRCQTCHDIPGVADEGFLKQDKVGPSLEGAGEKLNASWIRAWLADPQAVRAGVGMPRFRFAPGEIDAITAFLLSLRDDDPPAEERAGASPGGDAPARANRAWDEHRCGACHLLEAFGSGGFDRIDLSSAGSAAALRWSDAGFQETGIEGSEGVFHTRPGSPRTLHPGEPAQPIFTFLAGEDSAPVDAVPPAPPPRKGFDPDDAAGGLVAELRCLSCHTIRGSGGDIGPELTWAGSKLQRDWLITFLQDPVAIRPMNRARMPKLGISAEEAERLADWIGRELRAPEVDDSAPDFDSTFSFVGSSKVKSPYGCIACHRIGDEGGRVGPELTHVGSRLQKKWIFHWIKSPKHWIPGVRMPDFGMPTEDLLAISLFLSESR